MDGNNLELVQQAPLHLDTVRALHQTVVSLRTALELSKNELKELKEKYEQHSVCNQYSDIIEKLTLENHVLRRKIIDTECPLSIVAGEQKIIHNTDLEENFSQTEVRTPELELCVEDVLDTTVEADTIDNVCLKNDLHDEKSLNQTSEINEEPEISEVVDASSSVKDSTASKHTNTISKELPKSCDKQHTFKTKLELLSKFDVKIKVKTLKEGITVTSTTTSESESTVDDINLRKVDSESHISEINYCIREKHELTESVELVDVCKTDKEFKSAEVIDMAVPSETESKNKNDKFDVQVRITSEENLVVKDYTGRPKNRGTLNLDVDDLSLRSLSEGDNSVFSDDGPIPADGNRTGAGDKQQYEQENVSENESEEVDDIELIFTTDESKDMSNLQEDLVSIRDTEQWGPSPTTTTHSTPVLLKFHTLDPDFQPGGEIKDNAENENQENVNLSALADFPLKVKRVSLPCDKDIRQVAFTNRNLDLPSRPGILKSCDNKSDNTLYSRSPNVSTRRLNSVDSLTCEYNRGLSFDNTKSSSFELGSSMDILNRDESIDSFHRHPHLGHRFSVFAATDISKCGISEDDLLSANVNIRRNTCPNPFQYRPLPSRNHMRLSGPFKAAITPAVGHTRPILRPDNYSVRRENGAQTEVSALPPRWSSEGYLAHKVNINIGGPLTTLPSKGTSNTARRLTVPDARPAAIPSATRRSDETRRVMLSDIGFTSMVPELSRSADPLWAATGIRRTPCATCGAPSPLTQSTSKFLSRGSSYRSQYASVDRSNDWTPQMLYSSAYKDKLRLWRSSLPDVRGDDTDELLDEAEVYLRRSIDNLSTTSPEFEGEIGHLTRPYIPAEPRHLRLGHTVKLITPQGRIAVGRVRYVGLAGGTAADSGVMVGAILPLLSSPSLPINDGTYRGRRYFHVPPHHTSLFVPFSKVVMAWAN